MLSIKATSHENETHDKWHQKDADSPLPAYQCDHGNEMTRIL